MRTSWRDRFPKSMLMDLEAVKEKAERLQELISITKPKPIPASQKSVYSYCDCNEVYPNVFIGDGMTAKNKKYLKDIGITHVVNTAKGHGINGLVDTSEKFYESHDIKFWGAEMMDVPWATISQHFHPIADFMDEALAAKGKVYVHCVMGISRSSTCVIAFLMIKRGMTAEAALQQVRLLRNVVPNEGFLRQLAALDIQLGERRSLDNVPYTPATASESTPETKKKKLCGLS